jgi:hypothetical protein
VQLLGDVGELEERRERAGEQHRRRHVELREQLSQLVSVRSAGLLRALAGQAAHPLDQIEDLRAGLAHQRVT